MAFPSSSLQFLFCCLFLMLPECVQLYCLYCTCLSMQRTNDAIFDMAKHSPLDTTDVNMEAQEVQGHALRIELSLLPSKRAGHLSWCQCRYTIWLSLKTWNSSHFGHSSQVFIVGMNELGTVIPPLDDYWCFIIKARPVQITTWKIHYLSLKDNVAVLFCSLTFMKSFKHFVSGSISLSQMIFFFLLESNLCWWDPFKLQGTDTSLKLA